MRNPLTPLGNASFDGFCKRREVGPLGMITLRAKALAEPELDGPLIGAKS